MAGEGRRIVSKLTNKGRNDEEEFRKKELDVPDASSDDRHIQ